jgi:hypothetical protein
VLASAGRLARTLGVMSTRFCAVVLFLLAAALAAPAAATQGKKQVGKPTRSTPATEHRAEADSMPGRTERASTCDLAALSETIELHRRAEPSAARAQLEAIRIAIGQCTGFVLAVAYVEEVRKFCSAPETYSAARTARELRRRIAALDANEVLRSSNAGQVCQAAYKHELKTTRVVLRPASR